MADYRAPLEDMKFALRHNAGYAEIAALPGYEDASWDVVEAVLEEAAKVAGEVVSPLNPVGDTQGARRVDGRVVMPEGWKQAFDTVADGGWIGLACDPAHGGQGLPFLIGCVVSEMMEGANVSFAICNLLTQGAIDALELAGTDSQKALFVPPMIAGRWTGTMNLTEAQAGSDLAAVRTRAVPDGDRFLITGQKIFITYGDQDMTENVIHLVLARLPDAPPGVKGISLFVVPKVLVGDDGTLGAPNDLYVASLENKLGIHASPTAVMCFGDRGGAVGYLVGEANRGLEYMFAMMNRARFEIGIQGIGLAEMAYQRARDHALERVQGTPLGRDRGTPIIGHPDVRRMLMEMKCRIEAMRAVAYWSAGMMDRAARHDDSEQRRTAMARVEFLTPIVKGWCSEVGQELTSVGIQVHGGPGFVEETGVAQYYRDARIMTIYEGTTGIQANDLVFRKVMRDGGAVARTLVAEFREEVPGPEVAGAVSVWWAATDWLLAHAESPELCAAGACHYLRLAGTVFGGVQLSRAARAAEKALAEGDGDPRFLTAKIKTAEFYLRQVLPEAATLAAKIGAGADSVFGLDDDQF